MRDFQIAPKPPRTLRATNRAARLLCDRRTLPSRYRPEEDKPGFTLIELLVVIAIITILAAMASQ